ncbi:HPr family phosphocarrier protein [Streptomyces mirabilis]|uniref:HPr family phosphocarrier protein n=1 Tax=Streptomyces mirabilis TaxID=68239 RepID=UPI00364C7ECD
MSITARFAAPSCPVKAWSVMPRPSGEAPGLPGGPRVPGCRVAIESPSGLHACPASQFVRAAARSGATASKGGVTVGAAGIRGVMSPEVGLGVVVHLARTGEGASEGHPPGTGGLAQFSVAPSVHAKAACDGGDPPPGVRCLLCRPPAGGTVGPLNARMELARQSD